eukprot:scaffold38696_cov80-Attheya_sp.AAC.2
MWSLSFVGVIGGTGNNVMTVTESRHIINRSISSPANKLASKIDTGTYHPASASKITSSSSSLASSKGRLMLALDEVGLSSPRSFASTSVARTALLRVILPSLSSRIIF